MDPSGTYIECQAKAIGSASEGAQQTLQETYHTVRSILHYACLILSIALVLKAMTLNEAVKSALSILKQVMEEKLTATNVEVAVVKPDTGFQIINSGEIQTIITSLT